MNDQIKKISNLSPKQQEVLLRLLRKGRDPPSVQISPRKSQSNFFPLSFAQQRLWHLYQWAPGTPFCNISVDLRLEGKLNKALLHDSLTALIQYEAVWTSFSMLK